jgi:hypothetical protein
LPGTEGFDQSAYGGPSIVLALGKGAGEDGGVAGLGDLEGAVESVLDDVGGEGGPGFAGVEPEEAGQFEEVGDIVIVEMIPRDLLEDERGGVGLLDPGWMFDEDAGLLECLGYGDGGGGIIRGDDADGGIGGGIFGEPGGDLIYDQAHLIGPFAAYEKAGGAGFVAGGKFGVFEAGDEGLVFAGETALGAGDALEAETLFEGFDPFALPGIGGKAGRRDVHFE